MDLRKVGFTPPYRLPDTKKGRLLACLLLIYRNDIKMSFDVWFSGEEAGGLWKSLGLCRGFDQLA